MKVDNDDRFSFFISKLTNLFIGLSVDEVDGIVMAMDPDKKFFKDFFKKLTEEEVNYIILESRKRAKVETRNQRRCKLGDLFVSQINTLKSAGCPTPIIEAFSREMDNVTSKAVDMDIPENHIPFIPVIPRIYLGIWGLLSMLKNNDQAGYTDLEIYGIIDTINVPRGLYFIYDVEDGKKTKGEPPANAAKIINKQGRSGLTVDEGIALAIHTKVDICIDCIGSFCKDGNGNSVPDISEDIRGCYRLSWHGIDSVGKTCGSPSCRARE